MSEANSNISRLKSALEQERKTSGEHKSSQSTQLNFLNNTIRKKDEDIESLSNDLKITEGERDGLKDRIKDADEKIQLLRDEKASLQNRLALMNSDLENFKNLNPDTAAIISLKEELEQLKASREADLKAQEESLKAEFKKTVENYEHRIIEEKKQAVEEARQPLLDALEDVNDKLNKAKEETLQVRNNAKQRFDDLKAKHADELNGNIEKHRLELQSQREKDKAAHEAVIKTIKEEFGAKLEESSQKLETQKLEAESNLKAEQESSKKALDAKDAEISKIKASAEEEKSKLNQEIKSEQGRADRLYSRLEGQLRWIMNGIIKDLRQAWPEGKEGSAGVIVNDILSQNDMITLNEYMSDFVEPALEGVKSKSEEELDDALDKVYRELLSPKRPTWLDSLLRLDALVRVPFIATQFSQEGLDVQKVQRAADKANSLLAFNGIITDVPKLFSDLFDREKHEAQPIKDISTQVDDVASHVKDPETLVDIFTIGYHSEDGELSRRPAVSRLNA